LFDFRLDRIPNIEVIGIQALEFFMSLVQTILDLTEIVPDQLVIFLRAALSLALVLGAVRAVFPKYRKFKVRRIELNKLDNQGVDRPRQPNDPTAPDTKLHSLIVDKSILNRKYFNTEADQRFHINSLITIYKNRDWPSEEAARNKLIKNLQSEAYTDACMFLLERGVMFPPTCQLDDPEYISYSNLINEYKEETQGLLIEYAGWQAGYIHRVDRHKDTDWDSLRWSLRRVRKEIDRMHEKAIRRKDDN